MVPLLISYLVVYVRGGNGGRKNNRFLFFFFADNLLVQCSCAFFLK